MSLKILKAIKNVIFYIHMHTHMSMSGRERYPYIHILLAGYREVNIDINLHMQRENIK